MVPQWEYTRVEVGTNVQERMIRELNRLGAEGWEVIGVAAADRTLGLNSVIVLAKRPIVAPSPPADITPGWQTDPCGRWEVRYWDGARWTAHVANRVEKRMEIDPPQSLAASIDEIGAG